MNAGYLYQSQFNLLDWYAKIDSHVDADILCNYSFTYQLRKKDFIWEKVGNEWGENMRQRSSSGWDWNLWQD